ncbi:putative serine/threonine-protein kinase HSL1 [Colletotrichum sidae]|uniref:non-specific serine/threonine protein kinase n=1 Tax=Colletotrichum sidae TaxID=1347389 RepID=A0A4R8T4K9_9PEZI|nr:putative serine/threonine-protein kinase HSL1 [Colletotrichum sidae]
MSETYRAGAHNPSSRPPLADATQRVINASSKKPIKQVKSRDKAIAENRQLGTYDRQRLIDELPVSGARAAAAANSRNPAVARARASQDTDPSKRMSQVSQTSTVPSSKRSSGYGYKTHIGPWLLGKTLGKGSSARVRLCKHRISGELAAVKIVPKKTAYLIQAGSLAELHDYDDSLPERINGEMRVPLSIEREVAILKLVDHPNVMKVYDIWENRSEIYLVLEYVEQGDLFDYINTNGRFSEESAMFIFRQMMSALQYCHSFNICHRDLKPENILLTSQHKVKIADFGMAALHQSSDHRLVTACGSPHYAAPELLKHRQYRGDKADIWSLGVILYALLAACLPFDDPDIGALLQKTKRGIYEIPDFLSPEAKDLIRRMLVANPETRISIQEMWQHPLIQKYDYLDNLGSNGKMNDLRKSFHYTPLKPHEVDPHLVRQLRSLWHMFTEHQIKLKLMDSANRIVSAPPKTPGGYPDTDGLDYLVRAGDTIRVVNSPSATSTVPKPLNVRKKSTERSVSNDRGRASYPAMHGASGMDEPPKASSVPRNQGPAKQKKSTWFKRSSKDSTSQEGSVQTEATQDTQAYSVTSQSSDPGHTEIKPHHAPHVMAPAKKKGFGLLFWKSDRAKQESKMMIAEEETCDETSSVEPTRGMRSKMSPQSAKSWNGSDKSVRNIEVQQNWLARLFGVKPATSYVCLPISRKRARQEMTILLKDWRRYGMRDIQVDKERNIVFARVGAKNYLSIKEVAFAAEIMTVIEHGKKGPLCIMRFTQERGAASSFHKVVDTVRTVFESRGLLVVDKRKEKMMIKTLNS